MLRAGRPYAGLSGLDLQVHLLKQGNHNPGHISHGPRRHRHERRGMKAGAKDFLTKPVRDQTFLDAVSRAISADLERREAQTNSQKHIALYQGLTARNVRCYASWSRGSLNKQIGFELGISEVTVKLHRSNMMKQMQVTTFNQLFTPGRRCPPIYERTSNSGADHGSYLSYEIGFAPPNHRYRLNSVMNDPLP